MSPTERTLKLLRERGYWCGIVERFVGRGKFGTRIDLFGIIDIIALTPKGVMGVQSCGQTFSDHMRKITIEKRENALKWLETPGTSLVLIGWRPLVAYKKDGTKAKKPRIAPRVHIFNRDDFGEVG